LISLIGGAVGLWGSVALLRWLSVWHPVSKFPINLPVSPDADVYGVALLLSLASGFLFGAVPIRQILRTDPYEIVKSGSISRVGRRLTVRDLLLAVQIAICAVIRLHNTLVPLRWNDQIVHRLRDVLGDTADAPRFIETPAWIRIHRDGQWICRW